MHTACVGGALRTHVHVLGVRGCGGWVGAVRVWARGRGQRPCTPPPWKATESKGKRKTPQDTFFACLFQASVPRPFLSHTPPRLRLPLNPLFSRFALKPVPDLSPVCQSSRRPGWRQTPNRLPSELCRATSAYGFQLGKYNGEGVRAGRTAAGWSGEALSRASMNFISAVLSPTRDSALSAFGLASSQSSMAGGETRWPYPPCVAPCSCSSDTPLLL